MNQIYKYFVPIALLAAIALVSAGGCGSDDDSGETSPALTKTQFLEKGNEICRERLEEKDEVVKVAVEELSASGKQEASRQMQEEVGESILSSYRHIANELGALEPPAKDEDKVEHIV